MKNRSSQFQTIMDTNTESKMIDSELDETLEV